LRRRGAGPNVVVGLLVDRSIETLVGLPNVLEAGGACVPLDHVEGETAAPNSAVPPNSQADASAAGDECLHLVPAFVVDSGRKNGRA
jgi:non-ribosomal peptide synthetase component F